MKAFLFYICIVLPDFSSNFADKVNSNDLKIITGDQWKGKLTYLDYSSNQKTSISAHLMVQQSTEEKNIFYFIHDYPKEPKANKTDTVIINNDGKQLNDQSVIKKEKIGNIIKLITESSRGSKDELKYFRYTYLLGSNLFSIKKEEKGMKDTAYFTRNIYEYQRKSL
jgi:hypothetical protein